MFMLSMVKRILIIDFFTIHLFITQKANDPLAVNLPILIILPAFIQKI